MPGSSRARVQSILGDGGPRSVARAAVAAVVVAAIVLTVVSSMLETVKGIGPAALPLLLRINIAAGALFTVEYALRLWCAPEANPGREPWSSRGSYARSFLGTIDLIAAIPGWIDLASPGRHPWLSVIGLLPLLKLSRYAPGLDLVAAVFRNEGRALVAAFIVMAVLLVLASGVMYVLERDAQTELFASIPHALWWGVVTMATVGYGDMVPVTLAGRVFGTFVIFIGIALFAVPAGIFATGFAAELRRRDFIVTWQSVARVRLFAGLDASRIAAIARLMRPQFVPAGSVIVRRGEAAESMYVILDGEVEVVRAPEPVRLRTGEYFGEIGLLRDLRRTATVVAIADCQLLALGVLDFRRLLAEYPDLKASIEAEAERRLAEPSAGA